MEYSIQEIATRLGLTIKVVRRLVASGELTATKRNGAYRISEEALHTYTNNYTRQNHKDKTREDKREKRCEERLEKTANKANWTDISDLWNDTPPSELTFVDLFCGAGGLSKGLEMAGMNGICGLDWFEEAGTTYKRNFHHPFLKGDISLQENKEQLYTLVRNELQGRHLNIVAGGFPCQGFSMAGNRIADDPRNTLYLEMLAIVNHLQPDFVICENVKGIRSMLNGRVEQRIIDDYKRIGYNMNVATLCAADYYTPQKRERVIFIGNRIGLTNYHPTPLLSPENYITTGMAIQDLIDHPDDIAFNHQPTKHNERMQKKIAACPEGESLYEGYSDAWKKCPWDQPSCTIKENHGGVNLHPKLPRVLTAREMARLQSFPDDFIFMGNKNKQLVQIGNAVPPLLGKAIGLAIIKSYHHE